MYKVVALLVSVFIIADAIDVARVTPAPTKCKKHEVYLKQGEAPNCQTTCQTLGEICNINYFQAPFGCYCIEGYAKDENNVCIPICKCPPKVATTTEDIDEVRSEPAPIKCKKNEVYLRQGEAPNCDTECRTLGEVCTVEYIQAPFGCYCVKGYARNGDNICIPIRRCPPKTVAS